MSDAFMTGVFCLILRLGDVGWGSGIGDRLFLL